MFISTKLDMKKEMLCGHDTIILNDKGYYICSVSTAEQEKKILEELNRPKIGVCIMVQHDDCSNGIKFLMCQRKKSNNQWAYIGGHMEYGESILQTAERELFEESGLHLSNDAGVIGVSMSISYEKEHCCTFFVRSMLNGQTPIDKEPDKHGPFTWVNYRDIANLDLYAGAATFQKGIFDIHYYGALSEIQLNS